MSDKLIFDKIAWHKRNLEIMLANVKYHRKEIGRLEKAIQ